MKTTKLFSIFLAFLLVSTADPLPCFAQDSVRFSLPEDTKPESRKANITAIQYSRNGKLLAVTSPSGTWLYDIDVNEELPMLKRYLNRVSSVAFSPDGENTGRRK